MALHRVFAPGLVRAPAGGGGASILRDGNQNFQNFNSSLASWTGSRTFTTATNLLIAVIVYENNTAVDSVAIDPAGANIALSQIASVASTSGFSRVAIWGVYDFASQSGAKDVVVTFNVAGDAAGSLGLWGFKDATKLPVAGDFATQDGAGTSATAGITVDAGEEAGFILAGVNVNILETVTSGGGLAATLHENQGAAGSHTCAFSHNLGPLSGTEQPSMSWTSNARRAFAAVLVI